mgnify:CR=1 FL=1
MLSRKAASRCSSEPDRERKGVAQRVDSWARVATPTLYAFCLLVVFNLEMRDDYEAKGAPTPFFDVVVLERSQKRKPKIPLGISVEELKALSGIHFRRIRLHGARECIPKCALRVVEVHEDDCPYSISNASQNGLLREGDYLVGVNDHYPDDVSTLAKLAGNSVHRRVLTMARPHNPSHDEGSVIQI